MFAMSIRKDGRVRAGECHREPWKASCLLGKSPAPGECRQHRQARARARAPLRRARTQPPRREARQGSRLATKEKTLCPSKPGIGEAPSKVAPGLFFHASQAFYEVANEKHAACTGYP